MSKLILEQDCKIAETVSFGEPHHKSRAASESGILSIGANVVLRDYVVIDYPVEKETRIGKGSYIMAFSYVGHDSILSEDVVLCSGAKVAGFCSLGKGVYVGMNASIHQHSVLGDYCLVGANSFFKGHSSRGIIWTGVPARPMKINEIALERSSLSNEEKEEIRNEALYFLNEYAWSV